MENRSGNVVDYFVIAGLPVNETRTSITDDLSKEPKHREQYTDPITDIAVIFPTLGESVPEGFDCLKQTPLGHPANLNSGSPLSPEVYLCVRRGRDKPPLVGIGVLYEDKDKVLLDAQVLRTTPEGRVANVNNTSSSGTFLTFRRSTDNPPANELAVSDICVILEYKGERPPPAFYRIDRNLNRGILMSWNAFLCFKKSIIPPPHLSFKPEVLLRYPAIDKETLPCPSATANFCLPMGATIECWSKATRKPKPQFSTFVAEFDTKAKVYGAALMFYEAYPNPNSHPLTEEEEVVLDFKTGEKSLYVNKAICLISRYPFLEAFKIFLYYIHWMMVSTGPHDVSFEQYVSHLLQEVPFPTRENPNVFLLLSPRSNFFLSFLQYPDIRLPQSGASYRSMLNNLGTENCLLLMYLLLTEPKLLVYSLRNDVLSAVTEAISLLLFPLTWEFPCIPFCPVGFQSGGDLDLVIGKASDPFIVGVDARFFNLYHPPSADVILVDLDSARIDMPEDLRYWISVHWIPSEAARELRFHLDAAKVDLVKMADTKTVSKFNDISVAEAVEIEFKKKSQEQNLEIQIQEAFLIFMSSILEGYQKYLTPFTIQNAGTIKDTELSALFDFKRFINSRDSFFKRFYQTLIESKMFARFIKRRTEFCLESSEADDGNLVEAGNKSAILLLDSRVVNRNRCERIVLIMPPSEPLGLAPETKYSYNTDNFDLKTDQFTTPKLPLLVQPEYKEASQFKPASSIDG